MQPVRRHHRYTYAEYVDLENESSTKHEFLDGEIYAMAGGSISRKRDWASPMPCSPVRASTLPELCLQPLTHRARGVQQPPLEPVHGRLVG
jgi:hypothetical protein